MKRFYALIVAAALCLPSVDAGAWWQSIQQVRISSGSTPFSITQTTTFATATGTNPTNTFPGLAIGIADVTRIVPVSVCHGPNNATLSNFTIGAVTATQATSSRQNSGGGVTCEIWYAPVPTGTTATVQFDVSVTDTRIFLGVYRVVGATASFSVGGGAASASATSLAASVSIPAGGGALAGAMTHSASSGSGTPTNLTLDTNNVVSGTSTSYIGTNSTNSGSTSMGVSWTGATDAALTIATFTP